MKHVITFLAACLAFAATSFVQSEKLAPGRHKVRISLLDPGIVLQEICVLGD